MIVSHAIKPFRFGGLLINQSLWMDGKPWFTASAIRKFIGLKAINAVQRIVLRNPYIREFSKEIDILEEYKKRKKNRDIVCQSDDICPPETGDIVGQIFHPQKISYRRNKVMVFNPIGLQLIIMESHTPKARQYKIAVAHLVWAFINGKLREKTEEQIQIERMLGDYLKIEDSGEKELQIARIILVAGISRNTFFRWLAIYNAHRSPFDKRYKGYIGKKSIEGEIELEIRKIFFKDPTMGAKRIWKKIGSPKSPNYCAIKKFYRKLLDEYYAGFFPVIKGEGLAPVLGGREN